MKKEEYEKLRADLFKRWKDERPEYEDEGREFTHDGILDFDEWEKQDLKILFLLKEARNGFQPSTPEKDKPISGQVIFNIARWKYAINEIYKNPTTNPYYFGKGDMPGNINDIAIVEVKKVNEEKSESKNKEICQYAEKDKKFLKEQINLINPHIVLCGYTIEAYGDYIFAEDDWDEEIYSISEPKKCRCLKHRNRLVIDFYHPSPRTGSKELFDLLCRLLKEGNVFDKFDWTNK